MELVSPYKTPPRPTLAFFVTYCLKQRQDLNPFLEYQVCRETRRGSESTLYRCDECITCTVCASTARWKTLVENTIFRSSLAQRPVKQFNCCSTLPYAANFSQFPCGRFRLPWPPETGLGLSAKERGWMQTETESLLWCHCSTTPGYQASLLCFDWQRMLWCVKKNLYWPLCVMLCTCNPPDSFGNLSLQNPAQSQLSNIQEDHYLPLQVWKHMYCMFVQEISHRASI